METPALPFGSLYRHGFVRLAAAVPRVRVADPRFNAHRTIALAHQADEAHAALVVFPELGLSAYTGDDLFHQDALEGAVHAALADVVAETARLAPVVVVGVPLRFEHRLFNTAAVIHAGRVLGVVPKSYVPNYREFYEKRHFAAARDAVGETISVLGAAVPFGPDLVFDCRNVHGLTLHVEICEDVWAPIPPSTHAALSGATVLANLSASDVTVGKADYRRLLCTSQSARSIAAYIYTAAGGGESTTDLAWDGHALVCENGEVLGESRRFDDGEQLLTADVDLDRLTQDRMRTTSFSDTVHDHRERLRRTRRVEFELTLPPGELPLQRRVERYPYVPANPVQRGERCADVYRIQVQGLVSRLRATGTERVVVGVSGGLDSTQALIVAARSMDVLGLPRTNVLAYTMPAFGTTARTLDSARRLMRALGVGGGEVDIRPSATQMLRDIGHPAAEPAEGAPLYDVTYENVQAGERTSHLFRLANRNGALVVGTGDLSELALGWCTYGVGDHMSHYAVNASVPKTLIQFLIRWIIDTNELDLGAEASAVLRDVLDTEISPELIPADDQSTSPSQLSEDVVGPFDLQDFFLYYTLRFGYAPSKVAFLARHAWHDRRLGDWPDLVPEAWRREYALPAIKRWMAVFLQRFFASQFKRSAIPNAPKVGSGGSLSPRGDWRAPSDAAATAWLDELARNVPDQPSATG